MVELCALPRSDAGAKYTRCTRFLETALVLSSTNHSVWLSPQSVFQLKIEEEELGSQELVLVIALH